LSLEGSKDEHFSCFPLSFQTELTYLRRVLGFWNQMYRPAASVARSLIMVHHAGIMAAAARDGWLQRSPMAKAAAVTARRALRLLQLHCAASQAATKIAGQLLS
jgi:hypothetical protein